MKNRLLTIIALGLYVPLALGAWPSVSDATEMHVPFEQSINWDNIHWGKVSKHERCCWMPMMRKQYELASLEHAVVDEVERIPKKIHQIWLGGNLPNNRKEWAKTWQKYHPDWEYKLWTEEDLVDFKMVNQELFDALPQLGAKADVLRYEILNQQGGLYVDMDFECLHTLDVLHHCYDFFIGIEDGGSLYLANGLIGTVPGHPILKDIIGRINRLLPKAYPTSRIITLTGPIRITQVYLDYIDKHDDTRVLAFPHTYFYPYPGGLDDPQPVEYYHRPESFGVHHWACQWFYTQDDRNDADV